MFSSTLDQLTETLYKLQNEAAVLKSQGLRGGESLSDDQKLALTVLALQCRQLNELIERLAPSLPD